MSTARICDAVFLKLLVKSFLNFPHNARTKSAAYTILCKRKPFTDHPELLLSDFVYIIASSSQQNTILYFHDEWNKMRPQAEPTTHEEIKEHVREEFDQENLEFLIRVGEKLELAESYNQQGGTAN